MDSLGGGNISEPFSRNWCVSHVVLSCTEASCIPNNILGYLGTSETVSPSLFRSSLRIRHGELTACGAPNEIGVQIGLGFWEKFGNFFFLLDANSI